MHADLTKMVQEGFEAHNGWGVARVGIYGTNYVLRAVVDQIGLAGLPPNISIYPFATTERHGVPLDGSLHRYVAHFPASDFPVPVQGFWSVSMYTRAGTSSATRWNATRSATARISSTKKAALNMYIQSEEPTTEAAQDNWLPAPEGPFQLIMRLYGTDESSIEPILNGEAGSWKPPTILPCLENGKTAAGWNCAT